MVALSEQSSDSSFGVFVRDAYQGSCCIVWAVDRSPCVCRRLRHQDSSMPSLIHRIHPVLYQLLLSIMSGRRPRRSIAEGSRTCRSQGSTYGTDHAFWQRLHRVPSDVGKFDWTSVGLLTQEKLTLWIRTRRLPCMICFIKRTGHWESLGSMTPTSVNLLTSLGQEAIKIVSWNEFSL